MPRIPDLSVQADRRDPRPADGAPHGFPTTRWSAIVAASSSDEAERDRGFHILVESYWKPVYKYLRIRWQRSDHDAEDLTQAFFTRAIEKGFFKSYDPSKARFRTFLRVCLDGFVANEDKTARRLKRGGQTILLSLGYDLAEAELQCATDSSNLAPDEYFEREWVRAFFADTVERLRTECQSSGKDLHYRIFEQYYLEESGTKPSYEQLAASHAVTVTTVTNYLALARRLFRKIVLERLRAVTGSDREFQREARLLLGSGFK